MGDGHYMFGNKKVFAKIMNDKLVIKAGGGFMLIDEFIKNYGDESLATSKTTTTYTTYTTTYSAVTGRASPKRAGTIGAGGSPKASPKRTRPTE